MRRQSADSTIHEAARRFHRFLRSQNGDRTPRSERAWCRLALSLGVEAHPIQEYADGFTARLFYVEEHDLWLIAYNPSAPLRQRMRFICHELAEFLAVNDYPSLFDDLPDTYSTDGATSRVYHYTGGSNPDDLRHRIARRVEALCFRK